MKLPCCDLLPQIYDGSLNTSTYPFGSFTSNSQLPYGCLRKGFTIVASSLIDFKQILSRLRRESKHPKLRRCVSYKDPVSRNLRSAAA